MKYLSLFLIVLFFASCKKEVISRNVKIADVADENYKFKEVVFGPEKPSFTKEGTLVLNNDTIDVVSEYTDDIAFVQATEDIHGNKGVYNYRDMLIHLVNKRTNDTITLQKEMFRRYNYNNDFDELIMQSAVLDLPSKQGNIPLMVSLCKPETDVCDFYSISVINGKAVIEEVDLGEMGE
jgi:hypothetical protein